MKRLVSSRPASAALVVALILLIATPSRSCRAASLLPIVFAPGGPTVDGANGTLSYSATTGVFDASVLEPANDPNFNSLIFIPAGQPSNLVFLDPAMNMATLDFNLKVDKNGNFVSNGAGVTLTGGVDINGDGIDDASGTLLTGTITQFGAAAAGPAPLSFDGLFTITGGLLTSPVTLSNGGGTLPTQFRVGSTGGFIVVAENVTSGILGDFAASFSSSLVKPNLGVAIPEPGSLVLAVVGMITLGGYGLVCRRRFVLARRR